MNTQEKANFDSVLNALDKLQKWVVTNTTDMPAELVHAKMILKQFLGNSYGLTRLRKVGGSRQFSINTTYEDIVKKLGKPNVTDLDDSDKVKALWAFQNADGKKIFIWCYKYPTPESCTSWSADGDRELLEQIFFDKVQ